MTDTDISHEAKREAVRRKFDTRRFQWYGTRYAGCVDGEYTIIILHNNRFVHSVTAGTFWKTWTLAGEWIQEHERDATRP